MQTGIKICGLSTPETVDAAVAAGATHVGFVHFEKSPRHVSVEQAAALRARVPREVKSVLLTVNMDAVSHIRALDAVKPDIAQAHGNERAEYLGLLRKNAPVEVWKACGIKNAQSLEDVKRYHGALDLILYDAAPGVLPGGNGLALDWDLLAGYQHPVPWGLAGGLTPDNVGDAIRTTRPPLVDVSSGVESAPGVKDVDLIRAFCEAVRAA
ncbi:phosphoribosylanthranilate isomerase [Paraurantiacibacter namhicola]|uniref:N-(5'-phosphoribosyl)anthranilate isomerase n=1 Tax=Paraurantiacibacter namhicola TaxID=645517 RepID=A0A1C7D8G4_9SPHN|nr:phosphoribosylanthranilate isomerase [Paraurantiacibacter namhicola]ANU07735.1 N-(5'-phosphoribosyl)anthranilate isomerase [Paraurantiacibacter namhicola]